MVPPLRSLIVSIWVMCAAGAALIAGMVMGYVDWQVFAVAAVVGLVVGVPGGLWSARAMRRH